MAGSSRPKAPSIWHWKSAGRSLPSFLPTPSPETARSDKGFHSIRVNDQWRIVFRWEANNAYDVRLMAGCP